MGDLLRDMQAMIAGNQQLRAAFGTLQAERDQLRAEADTARDGMRQLGEDLVASRAEVERLREYNESLLRERDERIASLAALRGALEEAGDVVHACFCETEEIRGKVCHPSCIAINTALALTPASAGARLKAEALREAAKAASVHQGAKHWEFDELHDFLLHEADRLTAEAEKEAANG